MSQERKAFAKQMSLDTFKETYKLTTKMKIFASVKNPGKYFGAYETPEGSFTIPASSRFADAEYAQRAIQRGMNLGMTDDGTWIVFAKGEGLTALLEG